MMVTLHIAMKKLFYNAVRCELCKDVIQSYSGHDYKACSCGNASVDGGLNYGRWGRMDVEESVTTLHKYIEDHPFSEIRQFFYRWNNRKEEHVLLKDIDDYWLENILKDYIPPNNKYSMPNKYLLLFLQEKQYRNEIEV